MGTTSACAENTFLITTHDTQPRNYLRVRGEYSNSSRAALLDAELPPRARRIQAGDLQIQLGLGTTSACAENTPHGSGHSKTKWNYLRVRGEYALCHVFAVENMFFGVPL